MKAEVLPAFGGAHRWFDEQEFQPHLLWFLQTTGPMEKNLDLQSDCTLRDHSLLQENCVTDVFGHLFTHRKNVLLLFNV